MLSDVCVIICCEDEYQTEHSANTNISHKEELNVLFSPILAYKADVEFTPLQVFTGITHDLIKGILQKVVPAYDQPGTCTKTHSGTV